MAISKADFWSFISEFTTRNPNLGIPPLEDRLFSNLLIFDYSYYISFKREGTKGREKGREMGREKGKGKRGGEKEGKKEREKGREKGKGKGKVAFAFETN